jgi:hypothetical protein
MRRVVKAIRYGLVTGGQWAMLPKA